MSAHEASALLPTQSHSHSHSLSQSHGRGPARSHNSSIGSTDIPSSVRAREWSALLGLLTTMVGAGILTLPGAFEATGVIPGILLFVLAAYVSFISFEMICASCDATNEYSYEALSSRLFGAASVWMVRILTLGILFGALIMYMVTAMDVLEPLLVGVMSRGTIGLVFTIVAIPLCLPETIYELRFANLLVVSCVLYIFVAIGVRTIQNDPAKLVPLPPNPNTHFTWEIAAIAYVVPIIVFSFGCQLNIPRAYQELGDRVAMRRVNMTIAASGIVIYVLFALLGYLCFHGHPPGDILTGFRSDDTMINAARLCLGICMLFKMPMTFQPMRQTVELITLGHDRESLKFRAIHTVFFMVAAHFFSLLSTDLGKIMSFLGALAGNLLMVTVPGMFLWEISKGFFYEARTQTSKQLAGIMTWSGVLLSVISLTYLIYAGAAS